MISARYFCLIKDVLCNFAWFTNKIKCTFTVFIPLFIIPLQSVIGKSFAKPLQGGHGTGKTGNLVITFSRQGKHREFRYNTGNFPNFPKNEVFYS